MTDAQGKPTMNKPTRALLDALAEAGWQPVDSNHYRATFEHPACDSEQPTPAYVPRDWWPEPTYRPMRQVTILIDPVKSKAIAAYTREGTPWRGASEAKVSLRAAVEYVREEWRP